MACSTNAPDIENKEDPAPLNGFTQLSFEAGACFGTCPQFSMSIQADGSASYLAKNYNDTQGNFTTGIKKAQLDSLMTLVADANVYSLKDTFRVPITDQATYYLQLQTPDGRRKSIMDYGARGSDGLKKIYDFIFSLRRSQNWK